MTKIASRGGSCLNPSTVFHTKIRIPVRINFPWQQHLAPWSAWHDIMLINCAMKKRVQRYQEHHRVIFEVFELSSAKEGRVSLFVDVFPSASWALVKVRTSAWRATWKTLVLALTWREWAQESSIAAAMPQAVMDRRRQARGTDEESNHNESDIAMQRKVLPVARALGRRRLWFHCACRVRLSYLRPSPFLLAISSTEMLFETLFAYAGEVGRGEWCGLLATWKSSRSWRRTRTWHRLTNGSLGSSGIILVVALEYNVNEGDVDWKRATWIVRSINIFTTNWLGGRLLHEEQGVGKLWSVHWPLPTQH